MSSQDLKVDDLRIAGFDIPKEALETRLQDTALDESALGKCESKCIKKQSDWQRVSAFCALLLVVAWCVPGWHELSSRL